jgi:hypothetical protein
MMLVVSRQHRQEVPVPQNPKTVRARSQARASLFRPSPRKKRRAPGTPAPPPQPAQKRRGLGTPAPAGPLKNDSWGERASCWTG